MRWPDDRVATVEDIAAIAMEWDTVVARAFRRLLGLPDRIGPCRRRAIRVDDGMDGMLAECFANRESYMDVA